MTTSDARKRNAERGPVLHDLDAVAAEFGVDLSADDGIVRPATTPAAPIDTSQDDPPMNHPTPTHIDRTADEISGIQVGSGYESVTIGIDAAREAAHALDAAGLLRRPTDPEVHVEATGTGRTCVVKVSGQTVFDGVGREELILTKSAAEHDAAVAARALREAAEVFAKFARAAYTEQVRVGWELAHGALLGMADEAGERDE